MMPKSLLAIAIFLMSFSSFAVAQERKIASEPTATKPLEKGQKTPEVTLKGLDERGVTLDSLYKDKPLVIVFFRGGWCPICNNHNQQLIKIYPQLKDKGYELIGISPDSVQSTKDNLEKGSIPFPVYSDSQLNASAAFGLAFKVDDATFAKYKGFGLDLEKASGQTHHALPIPAIYIVNKLGHVVFAHSNPDYRERLDSQKILETLDELSVVPDENSQVVPKEQSSQSDKLTILWTSGDPEVAHRMVLMYAKAAKSNKWFNDVQLIIWGPSARLVAADKEIQLKLKEMQKIGIVVEACVVCADSYGVSDRLKELGIDVKPMGKPLSNVIRDKDTHLITF